MPGVQSHLHCFPWVREDGLEDPRLSHLDKDNRDQLQEGPERADNPGAEGVDDPGSHDHGPGGVDDPEAQDQEQRTTANLM